MRSQRGKRPAAPRYEGTTAGNGDWFPRLVSDHARGPRRSRKINRQHHIRADVYGKSRTSASATLSRYP